MASAGERCDGERVNDRGRPVVIFLPVFVTVLLAAVIGALIVVQSQRQTDQVTAADETAEVFLADVGAFEAEIARQLRGVRTAEPDALRRVLRAAVADPPRLGEASAFGAEQSAPYVAARETEQTLLQPYRRLDRDLRRADVALDFIAAARDALALRATDYVGSGVLVDSGAIRTRLVPAFTAARDELASVRVPKGQERLAATVVAALQHVIDQATRLAVSIETNQAYSFTYADQFRAAATAVDDYAATVDGDLAEALNVVLEGG
jgi:flagellar basal body-associated protein FliL